MALDHQNHPSAGDDAAAEPSFRNTMASQVGVLIRFAQAAVWSDLVEAFKPLGFRPQQYAALTLIADNPGCKQQDLGDALGIARSNLVMMIDELVAQGLITRQQSEVDRRSNALRLSPRGRVLLTELDKAQADHEARIAKLVDDAEMQTLARLLGRIARLK